MLQPYDRIVMGEYVITTKITCNDGQIRMVSIEQYLDGYHAFLVKDGRTYTNNIGYPTSRKAINAAAKW